MKKTRFTESQIINILKEGESGVLTVPELCLSLDHRFWRSMPSCSISFAIITPCTRS